MAETNPFAEFAPKAPASAQPVANPFAEFAPAKQDDGLDAQWQAVQTGKARFSSLPKEVQDSLVRRYAPSNAANSAVQGIMSNFGDEATAGVNALLETVGLGKKYAGQSFGERYSDYKAFNDAQLRTYERDNPKTDMAAKLAGGISTAALLPAVNVVKGATWLPSMANAGATGAVYGTLAGAGEGNTLEERGWNSGAGGLMGLGLGAGSVPVARGVGAMLSGRSVHPVVPDADQLRAAKDAAYQAAENAGVVYTPTAMKDLASRLEQQFADFGFHPTLQPGAAAVLNQITSQAGDNVTLKGLDTLRKLASGAYVPGNKPNNALVQQITNSIDDLIANPKPGQVLMGDAAAGSAAIREARDLASRLAKSDALNRAVEKADLRAASTGAGGNTDNAIRQNVRGLLEKQRGLKPDEQAMMGTVVRGTPEQNLARLIGKVSPEGNGLALMLHLLGGSATGGASLPLAGVGMLSKRYADRATLGNVDQLGELIRAGGNMSAVAPSNAARKAAITAATERLLQGTRGTVIDQYAPFQGQGAP